MLSQDDWCMKWIKNELRMNWNHMNYEVDIRWPVSLEIHWKLWEVVVSGCRTPWYFLMVISGPGTHQTESQIWIPNDSQNDSDSRNIHRDRRWAPCAPCALCAPRSYLGDLERRLLGCEVSFGITLSRFVKQLSKILNMFEHHLLGFSIVISAFLSYHWAFRSRLSLCHFVTLSYFVILWYTLSICTSVGISVSVVRLFGPSRTSKPSFRSGSGWTEAVVLVLSEQRLKRVARFS